ncbi:DUF3592 domain-containing protein [Streptoalloteichus hindustanus]|uniref:DUF3592 domain-containing protein n=1 Tax=Streptoalloteichus hindustanus TaxID=2017 RepID=A0A1M5JBB5_STRHI|nr:DUF3592 domain-containing protein [Streptoalloteichus hindustanus]SHG37858.1 hypothetical protein SAMN05444320_108211 [Streptoalloteichus hindustanus]
MTTTRLGADSLWRVRAVRHHAYATALVLGVCLVVALLSLLAFTDARAEVRPLTARAMGEVVRSGSDSVDVTWRSPDGEERTVSVRLAIAPPPAGTRAEVAYDPHTPEHAVVPGAEVLASMDRGASGLAFTAVVCLGVLVVGVFRLATRTRLRRRSPRRAVVRRVRVQQGLMARSWLETESEPQRWIPVCFDPALVTMPSPTEVSLLGDPLRDRLVAARVGDALLLPSGPVTAREPRGRRSDFPSRPDDDATARAAGAARFTRQLRVDAALVVPAPLIGLFWAYLDGGGVVVWAAASAVSAAVGLWWASLRGADPS